LSVDSHHSIAVGRLAIGLSEPGAVATGQALDRNRLAEKLIDCPFNPSSDLVEKWLLTMAPLYVR
jgi:hypothetical protein